MKEEDFGVEGLGYFPLLWHLTFSFLSLCGVTEYDMIWSLLSFSFITHPVRMWDAYDKSESGKEGVSTQ